MNKFILLLIIALLTSCLPEDPTRLPSNDGALDINQPEDEEIVVEEEIVTTAKWISSGLELETLTIDVDNDKNFFLRGDDINNFLSNSSQFQSTYCMVATYPGSVSNTPLPLYIKLVPFIDQTFVGQSRRSLRVNLNSNTGNNACALPIGRVNSSGNLITTPAPASIAFASDEVCLGCRDIITSNSITVYKIRNYQGTDFLEGVSTTNIGYNSLTLRIDINSNSGSGQSSCSNSQCVAQGFDCCVEGQCVDNKGVKTAAAQADPDGFDFAQAQSEGNPNWYKDYPQFYYICLEQPPEETDKPNDPEDPDREAQERLNELITDFECVEELIEKSPANPFHTDPIDSTKIYSKCEKTDTSDFLYFETVMKRLYNNCGCAEKEDLAAMVSNCPKYTYKAVYQEDNQGNATETIASIQCVTPSPENTPPPFQDLEVVVSSKRAPQRLFDKTGVEVNLDEQLPDGLDEVQEGEEFQYLDDSKLFPQNGSFNMNSIIGQIDFDRSEALHAKIVKVDFDKVYLISTIDGFFSPCPTCPQDSWFQNFSAQPNSSQGTGLQAVGFSTRRDTFDNNTFFGNYEDTVFGRACWVPPTMIPFSHLEKGTASEQRQTRQRTQAMYFANGYQRDWYGFNKGAIIASFDGVSWFAVGKNRVAQATSDTLYIAVNAPFADLSNATNHQISVQEYDFVSTAPNVDFDPNEEINSPFQNEAALCQRYHECETDAQCITKLGWEYSCADVTAVQTKWPNFSPNNAEEVANDSISGSLIEFLNQRELPPDSGTRRCVYRGAGAPCRTDFANIDDENIRKHLTCAPNFYCAKVNDIGAFNKEVARFARPIDEHVESKNHLFGQDANALGRPKDYTAADGLFSLPSDIQEAVKENLSLLDSESPNNLGICRPGKLLPSYNGPLDTNDFEPENQHANRDPEFRTDYISQIGSCNASLYTPQKYTSCPVLDENGNYLYTQDRFLQYDGTDGFGLIANPSLVTREAIQDRFSISQNACSLESLHEDAFLTTASTVDSLRSFSPFEFIEGRSLATSDVQLEPTLAANACLRRAGAVCHTDLDCSPNRLMADQLGLKNDDFFGNLAEKKYFEEFLVCGQAVSKPNPGDDNFNSFDITQNRCCRPVGEEITMYTEDSPSLDATESVGLRTDLFGSFNPNDPRRYSRYAVVGASVNQDGTSNIIRPSANTVDANNDKVIDTQGDGLTNEITAINQWSTIHETAARTCCGSNWVRKFADGTNDWSQSPNKLNIDISNYKCLNYRTPLQLLDDINPTPYYGVSLEALSRDRIDFCVDPNFNASGCSQNAIGSLNDFPTIRKPTIFQQPDTPEDDIMVLDSSFENMEDQWIDNLWSFSQILPLDNLDIPPVFDWTFIREDALRLAITTRLPAFITFDDSTDNGIITAPNPNSIQDTDIIADQLIVLLDNPRPNGGLDAQGEITYPNSNLLQCRRIATASLTGTTCANQSDNAGICGPRGSDSPSNDGPWTSLVSGVTPDGLTDACENNDLNNLCCYIYNKDNRSFRIAFTNRVSNDTDNFENPRDLSVQFRWVPPGSFMWERDKGFASTDNSEAAYAARRAAEPGNAYYYLQKLAKFEYLGIPQMTYEPIYCNDNYQKIMPGVLDPEIQTVHDLINMNSDPATGRADVFLDPDVATPWNNDSAPGAQDADLVNLNYSVTQNLVDKPAIFSDNKFKCCRELGASVSDKNQCCSGFAAELEIDTGDEDDLTQTESSTRCALPPGTNLNVYFNKFVSGEGLNDNASNVTLEIDDFDPRTGEPLPNTEIIQKLNALGETFCDSGAVRRGGAFGPFQAEPLGSRGQQNGGGEIFSILDSTTDIGNIQNREVGLNVYNLGFRWNHHVYCDVSGGN